LTTTLFAPAQLAQLVTETLPALPEGHTSAIVAGLDAQGVHVVARFKLTDNHWTVTAAARRTWTGTLEGGAQVLLSW